MHKEKLKLDKKKANSLSDKSFSLLILIVCE